MLAPDVRSLVQSYSVLSGPLAVSASKVLVLCVERTAQDVEVNWKYPEDASGDSCRGLVLKLRLR